MNGEILRFIEAIHREKSIDKGLIFEAIESAIQSAAESKFGKDNKVLVKMNRTTGELKLESGGQTISLEELGRIVAQVAKQGILQKIKELEQNAVVASFETRIGEIVTGTVRRIDKNVIIVNIGKDEALLPKSEQVPGERYKPNEMIRAMIIDVISKGSKVNIILSRTHEDFVKKLFELEVPEIAEKIIEIKGIVREPGYRTKIAVVSNNPKVDPEGACIGIRGARIKNIIEELGGEKIDIIKWDSSPKNLIKNSLKPAEILDIRVNEKNRTSEVFVSSDKYSLVLGKAGQNVRLASRLCKWDIKVTCVDTDVQKPQEIENVTAFEDGLAASDNLEE